MQNLQAHADYFEEVKHNASKIETPYTCIKHDKYTLIVQSPRNRAIC